MYTSPRMPKQHTATTGRRPNLDNLLRSYIHANIPALRKRIEATETKEYQEKRLGLMERSARMEEEMASEAAKQGKIATGLSVAQTAGLGYMAHKAGWLGGGKAAVGLTPMATGSTGAVSGLTAAGAIQAGYTPAQMAAAGYTGTGGAFAGAPAGMAMNAPEAGMSAAQGGATGGGAGSVALPVAAAVGLELQRPYISKPVAKWGAENLPGGEKEWEAGETIATRTGQGALIGSIWGPPGTAVGAGIGATVGVVESVFSGCIIITAATNPHSYEVNVTRKYRDRYLSQQTLRGYYMIAEQIVPFMHKSKLFKRFIKKSLVDHIVRHCEWGIGIRKKRPIISSFITETFLNFCDGLGSTKECFIRLNGEVF